MPYAWFRACNQCLNSEFFSHFPQSLVTNEEMVADG
jgi:hypothetical protein